MDFAEQRRTGRQAADRVPRSFEQADIEKISYSISEANEHFNV
jgi:hypothetical protein